MNKSNKRGIRLGIMDKEFGIGEAKTKAKAEQKAFDFALARWCKVESNRAHFLQSYTCISPDFEGDFPAPRHRSCSNKSWQYPGLHLLFEKYDPIAERHTSIIELRLKDLNTSN